MIKDEIIAILNKGVAESIQTGLEFYVDERIYEEMENLSQPFELVKPILDIIGTNPEVDFGMPGMLVHFIERFYKNGYEELLMESVERHPTAHNIWMLHRCYNVPDDPRHEQYVELINRLEKSDKISNDIKEVIKSFSPWK